MIKKYQVIENNVTYDVEESDEYIVFYLNDVIHRASGPAYVFNFYYKEWVINGKLHRLDGPAVEYENDEDDEWWFNGKQIKCSSQKEFEQLLKLKVFW